MAGLEAVGEGFQAVLQAAGTDGGHVEAVADHATTAPDEAFAGLRAAVAGVGGEAAQGGGSFKTKADITIYPNPRPVEEEADVSAASVGVLIALGIILAPIMVRFAGPVAAEEGGAAVASKVMDFVKLAPQLAR